MRPNRIRHVAKNQGTKYMPKQTELPTVPSELTAGLLHCLSTLPDPWPPAKITINMDSATRWVNSTGRLFFADECVRHDRSSRPTPQEKAFQVVQELLPELEPRVIEFLAEWMVSLLMPAENLFEIRASHLLFILNKACWFRELFIGLKVAASLERHESFEKTIDGQVRCITDDFTDKRTNVIWNVPYVNVFIPAWTVPPIYHGLRRESIKSTKSADELGVKACRPTWFEDETVSRLAPTTSSQRSNPMHGLRLSIREEAIPIRDGPTFAALEEIASRGLLSNETWQCNRAHISLKAAIDVPLQGPIIEQYGDGLLDDSLGP